jgi:hypothetical protein
MRNEDSYSRDHIIIEDGSIRSSDTFEHKRAQRLTAALHERSFVSADWLACPRHTSLIGKVSRSSKISVAYLDTHTDGYRRHGHRHSGNQGADPPYDA